jgi:hypothetical protein
MGLLVNSGGSTGAPGKSPRGATGQQSLVKLGLMVCPSGRNVSTQNCPSAARSFHGRPLRWRSSPCHSGRARVIFWPDVDFGFTLAEPDRIYSARRPAP